MVGRGRRGQDKNIVLALGVPGLRGFRPALGLPVAFPSALRLPCSRPGGLPWRRSTLVLPGSSVLPVLPCGLHWVPGFPLGLSGLRSYVSLPLCPWASVGLPCVASLRRPRSRGASLDGRPREPRTRRRRRRRPVSTGYRDGRPRWPGTVATGARDGGTRPGSPGGGPREPGTGGHGCPGRDAGARWPVARVGGPGGPGTGGQGRPGMGQGAGGSRARGPGSGPRAPPVTPWPLWPPQGQP